MNDVVKPASKRQRAGWAPPDFVIAAIALLLLVPVAGCRTSRVEIRPFAPIQASSAGAAWRNLLQARREAKTLSSYATIRIATRETKRSFRASILADAAGRLRVSGFSPVGTEVFTLFADGTSVTFVDHVNRAWWKGSFAEAARAFGLPGELTAREFAMLAFGLPAGDEDGEPAEDSMIRQGGISYAMTASGLSGAIPYAKGWSVRYEPAVFPPGSVTFDAANDSSASVTIRHLDAGETDQRIQPLTIDPAYRCCAAPGWGESNR